MRALVARAGSEPRRAFGQNFVVDPNTVRRIARAAGVGPGDRVVEIGAGVGSLTLALAETGAAVTAIEVDRDLVPVLREAVEPAGVRVIEGDATILDWSALVAEGSWSLVANLPYNVATPLVLDLLDDVESIRSMMIMVQREAGERLVAAPGSKVYGAPSVKVRYHAEASVVGAVPASVFWPVPRVESVLVRIERLAEPRAAAPDAFSHLVRRAFAQRRKMIRSSLAGLLDVEQIAGAGVEPTARPEDLDVDAFCALARQVR